MTSRCSDAAFYVEGVKVPSGQGYVTRDGHSLTVVVGRNEPDYGQIHMRDLVDGDVVAVSDGEREVALTFMRDTAKGRAGRNVFDPEGYAERNGEAAARNYVSFAARGIPTTQVNESDAYSKEVAQGYLVTMAARDIVRELDNISGVVTADARGVAAVLSTDELSARAAMAAVSRRTGTWDYHDELCLELIGRIDDVDEEAVMLAKRVSSFTAAGVMDARTAMRFADQAPVAAVVLLHDELASYKNPTAVLVDELRFARAVGSVETVDELLVRAVESDQLPSNVVQEAAFAITPQLLARVSASTTDPELRELANRIAEVAPDAVDDAEWFLDDASERAKAVDWANLALERNGDTPQERSARRIEGLIEDRRAAGISPSEAPSTLDGIYEPLGDGVLPETSDAFATSMGDSSIDAELAEILRQGDESGDAR